jgi:hypothetical protein
MAALYGGQAYGAKVRKRASGRARFVCLFNVTNTEEEKNGISIISRPHKSC